MEDLFRLQEGGFPRWASPENIRGEKGRGGMADGGRKGSAYLSLPRGERLTLARAEDTGGTVRRIWMTLSDFSPEMLRGLRLECYWDGAKTPAVDSPLGDFFAMSTGRMLPIHSAMISSPEGRSFVCFFPMPFRREMRIVLHNTTESDLRELYYDVNYTVGDRHGEDMLYFHAWHNHQLMTVLREDFLIVPSVHGKGRFMGFSAGILCNQREYARTWWGEGEVKVYLGPEDAYPTLCGTGTEDYFSTGYGVDGFSDIYSGCHECDKENMRFSFYRFHIPDPIFFYDGIRVAWQQIGAIDSQLFHDQRDLYFLQMRTKQAYIRTSGEILDIPAIDTTQIKPILFERRDEVSCVSYFYHGDCEAQAKPLAPQAKG